MKKYINKYLAFGLVIAALGLVIWGVFYLPEPKINTLKTDLNQPHKDVARADNPDKFVALYNDLRTRASETSPGYTTGYALSELNKARQASASSRLSATYTFTERGPANVPGRTRGLVIDTDDTTHKTWFAGGVGGGIWKTVDAGLTWVDKTPNVPNMAISWLVMAESNHDIMYAGTGEGFQGAIGIRGNGIYKSTDRGENWNLLPFTIENDDFQMVNRLVVDPTNPDIVLAATSNDGANSLFNSGIFKSVDGGLNWTRKFSGQSWVQQIVATPGDFNTLYATVLGNGIYKSTDAGENWAISSTGLSAGGRVEMAVSPVNPSRLFASVVGGVSGTGSDLYISDDAGALWQVFTEENTGNDVDFLGGQGGYDNTILAHPYNQDIVYVGGVNLWKFETRPGTVTNDNQFLGAEEQNTASFLSLVNFGATYYGGKIDAGDEPAADFVSVEIRFGPDGVGGYLKQFAHRFTVPDGEGSGVPAANYAYQDYVEVPFQVWDVTNNKQLMASFRDQQKDSVFNLIILNTDNADWANNSREYIFAQNVNYDTVPDANISTNGGHEFKYLYNLWPYLTAGGTWDETNLPASKFIVNFGSLTKRLKLTTSVSDAYSETGGNNSFSQVIGSTNPLGVHPDHHNILPILWPEVGQDFQLLVAGDGGIYVSNLSLDPGVSDNSFSAAGLTYNTAQFYAADKAAGENRYIGGLQDNGSWMSQAGDEGSVTASYKLAGFGDGFGCAWNYGDPKQIITTSQYGILNKSRNGGVSFSQIGTTIGDIGVGKAPFVTEIENLHTDPDVVFTAGISGVWRSTNFGDSWQLAAIPDQWSLGLSINVRISQANSQIVWAGRAMREVPGKISLHVSTDEGVSFSPVNNYTDRELGTVSGLATHPMLDSTAFALFSFSKGPKILRTDDLGSSWYDISGFGAGNVSTNGFPDVALYDLLVMPYDTTIIWAGTEIGIFESTDAGSTWHILSSNMPATAIWEMKIVDNQVVIGSYGRGIWSVTINELPGQVYLPEIISSLPSLAGELLLTTNMSVAFDSTYIYIDGILHEKSILPSEVGISTLRANYFSVAPGKVYIKSFYRGVPYVSHQRNFELFDYNAVVDSYENDFSAPSSDFTGFGFIEKTAPDFTGRAIHSEHAYIKNAFYQYVLKSPIRVKSADALINFHEVVIIEPGASGSLPGTPEFNDFVVVQGSTDGLVWTNLLDEYDASDRNDWLEAYTSFKQGSETIMKFRAIDLLNTYAANDEVLIRFLLTANSTGEGWGWAIDNLRIQTENVITGIESVPEAPAYSVYPNPVTTNSVTIIRDVSNDKGVVNLFDLKGRLVLSQAVGRTGNTTLQLPAVLKDGLYSLIISSGSKYEAHKIIIQRNL